MKIEKTAKKQRFNFCGKLKELDMFSEAVQLNYDGGARLYKSYLGMVFSFVLFAMMFAYGV